MVFADGSLTSNRSRAALDLAVATLRAGDVAGAEMRLRDIVNADPSNADALAKLAEIAAEQRRIEEATVLLRRAVAADPSPDRRIELIEHLRRFAGPGIALKELETLPQPVRDRFEIKAIEAGIHGFLGNHERQVELYREMAREQPGEAGLWMSLGNALKTLGRTEDAVKAIRRAIRARPGLGEAYWTLANFKSFRFSPRDLSDMRSALAREPAAEDAIHLHFALGKAFEDRGDYEPSFRHYAAGNALRAASLSPDEIKPAQFVDESIAAYTPAFFERNRGSGSPTAGPIFVVGLHRSGSTLIEQILASHPLIEGTTELPVMNNIRDRLARETGLGPVETVARLKRDDFAGIGEEYLGRTRPFRQTDRPLFVDKMPSNWSNVALIRLALPNARIIDARRHPMACGFSNFKQHYAVGVGYSYSLAAIGEYYRNYVRFMRHIDRVQPGAVHRVLNERLIDDPEGEVRRLLDFIGVPFDPACLEFHKTKRAVATPSAEQVRRPINREGMDYWRHYEPWLGDLKAALGPVLDDWQD
jgi:tetratricopeptide (TPR) repeat protein